MARLLTLALVALLLASCNLGKDSSSQASIIATGETGSQLVSSRQIMDSMSAKQNPYTRQYAEWDYWLASHIQQSSLGPDFRAGQNLAFNEMIFETVLDKDGFLLPVTEYLKAKETFSLTNPDKSAFGRDKQWVYAIGAMDEAMFSAGRAAGDKVIASFLPPIPQWLATTEFQAATLLKDGRILLDQRPIYGQSHADMERQSSHAHAGEVGSGSFAPTDHISLNSFELYSAEGQLLGSTTEGVWWDLFGTEVDRSSFPKGYELHLTLDGYWQVVDAPTGHTVAMLDFDGKQLEGTKQQPRDPHSYLMFPKNNLLDLMRAQRL